MLSCTSMSHKTSDRAADTAVAVVPRAAGQDSAEIVNRVRDIYDHVRRAYGRDVNPSDLPDLNRAYASARFNALVDAVADIDSDIDGIGFFDFDYWVMGQDYDNVYATDIVLEKMPNRPDGTAAVTLNLHNCGSVTPLRLELVNEDGRWMIDNFINLELDFDLKASMLDYINENKR